MASKAYVDFATYFKSKKNKKPIIYYDATIYIHSDAYEDGLGHSILEFIDAVNKELKDKRFDDASYLASKFVVWESQKRRIVHQSQGSNLDFLGVGIMNRDLVQFEKYKDYFHYIVLCKNTFLSPSLYGKLPKVYLVSHHQKEKPVFEITLANGKVKKWPISELEKCFLKF